uniref:Uncharacterized protein n=1 Tax=Nelumbo nucifera TaxID=4432 RepID=A0A822ZC34_NELNU|nr:TPA_asm: hypothetical protein HUJ06_000922 [Nelumbo nucifera]
MEQPNHCTKWKYIGKRNKKHRRRDGCWLITFDMTAFELDLKKNHPKVEFNIAEEAFLHDHRKCTEKQEAAMDHYFLDAFLLDHDLISPAISMKPKQAETMLKSPPWLLELELEPELPVPALPVWLDSPIQWNTPSSPLHFEPVEFRLKPDDDISIGS